MTRETGESYLRRKEAYIELVGDPSNFKEILMYEKEDAKKLLQTKKIIRGSIPLRLSNGGNKKYRVGILVGGKRDKRDIERMWNACGVMLEQQNYLHGYKKNTVDQRLAPLREAIKLVSNPDSYISPQYYNWLICYDIPDLGNKLRGEINKTPFSEKRTEGWGDYLLQEVKDIMPFGSIPICGNLIFSPQETYNIATLMAAKALGIGEVCFVEGFEKSKENLEFRLLDNKEKKRIFPVLSHEHSSWYNIPVKAEGKEISPILFIGFFTYRHKANHPHTKPVAYINDNQVLKSEINANSIDRVKVKRKEERAYGGCKDEGLVREMEKSNPIYQSEKCISDTFLL